MKQNIFLQEFFKIIQYLYQLKSKLYILVALLSSTDLWKSNGLSEENIENIIKSNSNFPPNFADYHVLPDINFNGHYLKNHVYIPKKVINTYTHGYDI